RSVDPTSHALGPALELDAGPHAVNVAAGNAMLTPQVYVANVGAGSVTVLDQKVTTLQTSLKVGGRPVGVVRTVDGRLWVADADTGSVSAFDTNSGEKLQTLQVGPDLSALAATPDAHYLVLSSSKPDAALYAVDLVSSTIGGDAAVPVRHLAVPSGVLALATGAEITRAYATTADGNLLYWDLESNVIAQTIPVGHNPVGLTLGIVEPSGSSPVPAGAGTSGGGASSGGASNGGASAAGSSASNSSAGAGGAA